MSRNLFDVQSDAEAYAAALRKYQRDLEPKAVAEGLNSAARAAHTAGERNIKQKLTVRSSYTTRSLRFLKANPKQDIGRINAIVGSISPYLPIQDSGGKIRAKRRRVAVPSTYTRGGTASRTIARRFRLDRMGQVDQPGSKYFTLTSKAGKAAIFYRRTKRRIRKVRDLSKSEVRVPGVRWHSDAVERYGTERMISVAFIRAAKRELARLRRH